MPLFFNSKYEKKYRLESSREGAIQEIQKLQGCSREYAVRYYDYLQHQTKHNGLKLTSTLLYMYGAHKLLQSLACRIPVVSKDVVKAPVLAGGFYLGWVMYDKLVGHYLNWSDRDIAHTWEVDLKLKYGVKFDENHDEVPLTPYERMKSEYTEAMDNLNVEGRKVFKRLSKDKNDFFYLFGKVRNLGKIEVEEKIKFFNFITKLYFFIKIKIKNEFYK
jgi:hypothetical protein